ncbi:MAG: hypothetical protein ACQXXD_06795 [Thermoplasmatota archaeon]
MKKLLILLVVGILVLSGLGASALPYKNFLNKMSEEELITLTEAQTGLKDLVLIYKAEMEDGYDILFTDSNGERYFEVIVCGSDVSISEVYLQNVESQISQQRILRNYMDKNQNNQHYLTKKSIQPMDVRNNFFQAYQLLTSEETQYGIINPITGRGLVVFTRSKSVWFQNIFGVILCKLTVKGKFYSYPYPTKIIFISDMSSTYHDNFWFKRIYFNHEKFIAPGGAWGLIDADAFFDARYHTFGYYLWAWVQCFPNGSWIYDCGGEKIYD